MVTTEYLSASIIFLCPEDERERIDMYVVHMMCLYNKDIVV